MCVWVEGAFSVCVCVWRGQLVCVWVEGAFSVCVEGEVSVCVGGGGQLVCVAVMRGNRLTGLGGDKDVRNILQRKEGGRGRGRGRGI